MQMSTIVGPATDNGGYYTPRATTGTGAEVRSIENPNVSIHEWAAALATGVSGPTGNGANYLAVSPEAAMRVTTVMACVNWLANQLCRVRFHVFRPGKLGQVRVYDHPAAMILRRRPNAFQLRGAFQQTIAANAFRTGRGVAELVRRSDGRVVEMFPLLPERLSIEVRESQMRYDYTLPTDAKGGMAKVTYSSYDVIDIPGLSFDGVTTLNPIAYLRAKLSESLRRDALSDNMTGRGFQGGFVLKHPNKQLSPQQQETIGKSFLGLFGGAANAGMLPVLPEGIALEQLPRMTLEDAAWVESAKLTQRDICVALNVPPQALGIVDSKYNNLELMTQTALDNCTDPWLVKFEEAFTEALLTPEEMDAGWWIEANRQGLLAMDGTTRVTMYRGYAEIGVMNPDQIADRENLPRLPEERGTVYMQPVGLQPRPTPEQAEKMLDAIITSKERTGGSGTAGDGAGNGAGEEKPAPKDQPAGKDDIADDGEDNTENPAA